MKPTSSADNSATITAPSIDEPPRKQAIHILANTVCAIPPGKKSDSFHYHTSFNYSITNTRWQTPGKGISYEPEAIQSAERFYHMYPTKE